jgi:NADP-dependent 3-hydroxy acid dehydrogenase YdfG
MSDLKGKTVIITGASSGLGESTARHLVSLGANVVLGARREERLSALADELGDRAAWRVTDVTHREDLQSLAELALSKFGQIDALVNNAGIMPVSPVAMAKVEEWDRMIDVNIKGVLYGVNAVLDHMLQREDGTIINIASVAAHVVKPGGTVYSATKSAVRVISEGLRQELTGKVRVCTICPGATQSELTESISVPEIREMADQVMSVAMPAQSIADAVAYVLTQPASVAVNEIIVRPLVAQDH